jgi:hypothetical protein
LSAKAVSRSDLYLQWVVGPPPQLLLAQSLPWLQGWLLLSRQAPAPLHTQSAPVQPVDPVQPESVAKRASLVQVPSLPVTLQASQVPPHALSQQKPSTQLAQVLVEQSTLLPQLFVLLPEQAFPQVFETDSSVHTH